VLQILRYVVFQFADVDRSHRPRLRPVGGVGYRRFLSACAGPSQETLHLHM
jgi:hypothetical protein